LGLHCRLAHSTPLVNRRLLEWEMSKENLILDMLRERRARLVAEMQELHDSAVGERRELTSTEAVRLEEVTGDIGDIDARRKEIRHVQTASGGGG
jgi:hypothetical protein